MDVLKDILGERLHIELQLFRDTVLQQTKEEIYNSSYKIEVFVNAYEILLGEMEHLDEDTVRGLLDQDTGILDPLYQEWLTQEDGFFEEFKSYVESWLEAAAQMRKTACGKAGGAKG